MQPDRKAFAKGWYCMMLKNVMWNIFQDTGRIDAYLYYRSCEDKVEDENSDAFITSGDSE